MIFGLGIATLADRLNPRGEKFSKTLIFLPMAISMVGAATIWQTTIYQYQPAGTPQTGLMNAVAGLFSKGPVSWLQTDTLHVNSLLLMVILIWTQTGYAMVLLSAAIKKIGREHV